MDSPATLEPSEATGRLLLVDDEENILRSLRRVLKRGHWEIETAPNAERALEVVERFKPGVVISDYYMPGMSGVELLTQIKELAPYTQRILLTGQADQQAIEEAINRSEIFRFVGKPWNDAELLLVVKSAFEQHELLVDNDRLIDLTAVQNAELRALNTELEARVEARTRALEKAIAAERQMIQRSVESEKMIAIGHLAGGVAHEINNPLGGILAFAQLMKRDAGRTPADLEALDLIEESALRCKRIVESLLKFSRRPKLEDRRAFSLKKCVEDAVVLFKAQMKRYPVAKLSLELTEVPEIYGDSQQLGQVVLNLLQNSLQALPNGEGLITVTIGSEPGSVSVTVKDTGGGISPEHLSRVFEPHFTTKPPGEGTGLGLAIAYRIVEDHGGHFVVDSKLNHGSSFTVRIPTLPRGGATHE